MAATKILFGVFLCTILTRTAMGQDNILELFAGVSQAVVDLGRHVQCLAEKGDDSQIITKLYDAYDACVAGVKKNVDGPLTEEKFSSLLRIIVLDVEKRLYAIDGQCKGHCPPENFDYSPTPQEIVDIGKAAEAMGLTISCLLDDPKPEILGQFPVIVGAAIQSVATNTDTTKTSVGILLQELKKIVNDLQKLSSRCTDIKGIC